MVDVRIKWQKEEEEEAYVAANANITIEGVIPDQEEGQITPSPLQ